MERIDKLISEQTEYSRKEVKSLINNKKIKVNGITVLKSDFKVEYDKDIIEINGKELNVQKNIYLILNKPKGYVSATRDKNDPTVLELVPEEYKSRNLFPAGRLDKDTTGLMIITDDGMFAHSILSPKKHVKKMYNVKIDIPITDEMIKMFSQGVFLKDGKCKSANLDKTGEYTAIVTLTEGRYHQIKRMFGCFRAKVIELQRISMGNLRLPENLKEGECRTLTTEELNKLK